MDITITFQDGPIEAKIVANEDESYKDALTELADFVDEYSVSGQTPHHTKTQSDSNEDGQSGSERTEQSTSNGDKRSNSMFEDVDATDSELKRVLKVGKSKDGDIEEFPEIIGNTDRLGSAEYERLLNGSIVLLTILEEQHGISQAGTTPLKEALGRSGISEDAWDNIGKNDNIDMYLERNGSGRSATTELRGPGKEDAREQIGLLVEDLRETDQDGEQDAQDAE